MAKKDYLSITDLTKDETLEVFNLANQLKKELRTKSTNQPILERQTLAMIFEKPSLRTRISFEIGMTQLGGHAIYLGPSDIQMGKRETAHDVGVVTGSMADLIMARVFDHQTVVDLAAGSAVPVINGLSDLEHPCQVLADFLTMQETFGRLNDLKITWIGDGNNNVTHSMALLSMMLGNHFIVASPKGYEMNQLVRAKAQNLAKKSGGVLEETQDYMVAAKDADVIVTDTWVSMGAEAEGEQRIKDFADYQVTNAVMAEANKEAIFMHCLPAYRGKEVASEVIDGPQSVVFPEAENRLHAQKGLLVFLSQAMSAKS